MGLARNLSKFKPSSDGLVESGDIADGAVSAEKLGFTLSSNALKQSLPLKSGKTLTAGRAVNINSSGEVGDYPVVNTQGTLVQNTTTQYHSEVGWLSTDGSRALMPLNQNTASSGLPFSVRGVALTSTSQTTGSTVSLSAAGGYNFYMQCQPINETQFLIMYSTNSGTSLYQSSVTWYGYARVATVDASGNVTLGTANTWQRNNDGYAGYGVGQSVSPLPNGRFAVYSYFGLDTGSLAYFSRTLSISGTTITGTGDSDLNWFSTYPSFVTANNKLIGISGATVYYCTYDGTVTSSYANADLKTNPRGGWERGILLNSSYGLVAYNKSNYDFVLETFSINQTTGVPTVTSSYVVLPATGTSVQEITFSILSSTEIIMSYKVGTLNTALSIKLNSTGQVIGTGIGVVENNTGNEVWDIKKTGTNSVRYIYNSGGSGYSRDIAINSYDTVTWTSMGATPTSQTTSPAEIVVSGVCSGFTGLTPGVKYYVNESTYDGSLTTTQGNYLLGTAISSTEILLG